MKNAPNNLIQCIACRGKRANCETCGGLGVLSPEAEQLFLDEMLAGLIRFDEARRREIAAKQSRHQQAA